MRLLQLHDPAVMTKARSHRAPAAAAGRHAFAMWADRAADDMAPRRDMRRASRVARVRALRQLSRAADIAIAPAAHVAAPIVPVATKFVSSGRRAAT